MKKFLIAAAVFLTLGLACHAEDDNWLWLQYFHKGQDFYNKSQFTDAISEYKKALRVDPSNLPPRAGLINAYLSRATYYNDRVKDYTGSLNDLRSALFYIKFYNDGPIDGQLKAAANVTEQNINLLLKELNLGLTAQSRFNAAKQLRSKGEFAAAATEFNFAVSDTAFQKESYTALGDIANIMNLPLMALKYYENALTLDSGNPDLHLKYARINDAVGKLDVATNEYNIALTSSNENSDILNALEKIWMQKAQASPSDAEAQANLGAVYQKKGDYALAMELYQKAEKLNPANETTRLNLGTLYQLQKNYPAAIQSYNSILLLYPNNVLARYYKAQCLRDAGDFTAAAAEYKTALAINPSVGTAKTELFSMIKDSMPAEELLKYLYEDVKTNPKDVDSYYQLAYELHKANQLNDAVTFYKDTIKLDPKYADAYINLSQIYRQISDYPNSMLVIETAQKELPNNADVKKYYIAMKKESETRVYNEASKLFTEEQYSKAIEKYLLINPETAESLTGIGACYQKLDNEKIAAEYYKKALVLNPKDDDVAYYLALIYSNQNIFEESKIYINKALSINPNNQDAKDLLLAVKEQMNITQTDKALDLYDQKKYAEGLKLIDALIAQDPQNANAHYYRGMFLDALKKYDSALLSYQKALSYNKEMNLALYSMAVDYDYLAKYKEANSSFKKYLSAASEDNDYTNYAKTRVEELKGYE